ncbi:hypothetical protein [Streptomyces bacillaris]
MRFPSRPPHARPDGPNRRARPGAAAHRLIGVAAALVTIWITLRKGDRR